ncbi:unnamed protein product [Mycena citricolor]|uniref:Xylanolytic transcriptional activator regulatory domain-containing protein n=1 Tax=Mycena citricolor TaxID=2018698 RepID=A0AAD2GXA4_9AGAR|nr:unnamed protein product [Mycena citricolor]
MLNKYAILGILEWENILGVLRDWKNTGSLSCSLDNAALSARDHISAILSGSQDYVSADRLVLYNVLVAVCQYAKRLEAVVAVPSEATAAPVSVPPTRTSSESDSDPGSDDSDSDSDSGGLLINASMSEPMKLLTRETGANRFFGRFSGMTFLKTVVAATGVNTSEAAIHRPRFWGIQPWEMTPEIFMPQFFPEPDLLASLVDLFFSQVNTILCILHERTFRDALRLQDHFWDQKFGTLVLLVCAFGAKFSCDPRVFPDGTPDLLSAGWKWFNQVKPALSAFLTTGASSRALHDLQVVALSALYVSSGSRPEETWMLVGLGLRMAVDVGAHRRIRSTHDSPAEAEMYKRVFWLLMICDVETHALLGRPRVWDLKDFDVEYHAPFADEHPRFAAYGQLMIKLMTIFRKMQDMFLILTRKEQSNHQEMVAELDSDLNQWLSSVPLDRRFLLLRPQRDLILPSEMESGMSGSDPAKPVSVPAYGLLRESHTGLLRRATIDSIPSTVRSDPTVTNATHTHIRIPISPDRRAPALHLFQVTRASHLQSEFQCTPRRENRHRSPHSRSARPPPARAAASRRCSYGAAPGRCTTPKCWSVHATPPLSLARSATLPKLFLFVLFPSLLLWNAQSALYNSAIVLVLSNAREADPDVQRCLDALAAYERSWMIAGRDVDTLHALILAKANARKPAASGLKRGREELDGAGEGGEGAVDPVGLASDFDFEAQISFFESWMFNGPADPNILQADTMMSFGPQRGFGDASLDVAQDMSHLLSRGS